MLRVTEYFAKSLKVIVNGTTQKLGYGFLFAFHSNYGPILYRDKARDGRKSRFFIPLCIWRPRQNIAITSGKEKLERCGYPIVKTFEDMFSRVDSQTARRLDRQTNR